MTRRAGCRANLVEAGLEAALDPGRFVPYRACFSFVDNEEVENEIARLVGKEPARAVTR